MLTTFLLAPNKSPSKARGISTVQVEHQKGISTQLFETIVRFFFRWVGTKLGSRQSELKYILMVTETFKGNKFKN